MKNYMVTHTLKSDEAMDAYYQALETMSEADIRGAMKKRMRKLPFKCNGMPVRQTKFFSVGGKPGIQKQLLRHWVTWLNYLITTFVRCQTFMILQTDKKKLV